MRSRRMARLTKARERSGGCAAGAIIIGIFIARYGGVTGSCRMQRMNALVFGWCLGMRGREIWAGRVDVAEVCSGVPE